MAFPRSQYDVVLVQPPAKIVRERYDQPSYPAIGVAYVGGFLDNDTGVRPAIIDARLGRLSIEETVERIVALRPRIVGISAMTHMISDAAMVAERVKRILKGVWIVLGGVHGSFLPERTKREFPVFDFIVVGEGEVAFSKLVGCILDGRPFESIKGLCFEREGEIATPRKGEIPSTLDELGEPGWHLFDQQAMEGFCRELPVMTQRGCPFGCNFCSRPYGRLVRQRTPGMVLDEIEKNSARYNIERVEFWDETFTVDKRHTAAICQGFLDRGLTARLRWKCQVHANTVDEELARLMKESGCILAAMGVESGNGDILARMNKGINLERIHQVRRIFKQTEIPVLAFFIFGHPHETWKSILDTMKFAVRLNADETAIGIMVPYPGTDVWEMATRERGGYKKLSTNWQDYNKQLGNAVELEGISRRQIEFAQVLAYSLVFLLNMRFGDFARSLHRHYRLAFSILYKILFPFGLKKDEMPR